MRQSGSVTAAERAPTTATISAERDDVRRWWVLATCCATIFSCLMGPPIWSITPATLQEGFGANNETLRLYNSLSAVPQIMFLVLGGVLGDLFGRRRVLLIGMACYLIFNLLCLVAPGQYWLISLRTLSSWSGALATPLALATVRLTFQGRDLRLALMYYTGATGLASLLATLLGVVMVGAFGWRSMFVLPLTVGALTLLLGQRHLTESKVDAQRRPVDLVGSTVWATVSLVLFFALVVSQIPARWAGRVSLLALVVGLIGCGWWLWYELHALRRAARRAPVRKRELSVVLVVYALLNMVLVAYFIQLWSFWDKVRDYNVVVAVLALAPVLPGAALMILLRGRIVSHFDAREIMTIGLLIAAGAVALTALGASWAPYWWFIVPIMLVMMCYMGVATSWTILFFKIVQRDQAGANAAISTSTGLIGSVLGGTLGGTLLVVFGQAEFRARLEKAAVPAPIVEQALDMLNLTLRLDPATLNAQQRALLELWLTAYRQSYAVAFANVLFVLAACCLGCSAFVWFGLQHVNTDHQDEEATQF